MQGYSSQDAVTNVNPLCVHSVGSCAVFEGKNDRAEHSYARLKSPGDIVVRLIYV